MLAKRRLSESLRIVWAIAAKDIVEAIKNRYILGNIAAVLFTVVAYRFMPGWLLADEPYRVFIYDPTASLVASRLEDSAELRVYQSLSWQLFEEVVAEGNEREIGLVVPADFEQMMTSGEEPELDGYVVYWISEAAAGELKGAVEQELSELLGQPVQINLNEERIYPQPESVNPGTLAFVASISLLFALMMTGMTIVPQLMIEEKQTKTIDALLVSPAESRHLVLGKALAALFYCLTSAAVVLAFNAAAVVHWWAVLLVVLIGSLFATAMGMLLGVILRVQQQLIMWGFILLIPLLVPIYLSGMTPILPTAITTVITWLPTVTLARVFWESASPGASVAQFVPELAIPVAGTVLILAAVAWLIRRADR